MRTIVSDDGSRLRHEILLNNPVAQIAVGADSRLAMVNHQASAMLVLTDHDLGRPFQDLELSYGVHPGQPRDCGHCARP